MAGRSSRSHPDPRLGHVAALAARRVGTWMNPPAARVAAACDSSGPGLREAKCHRRRQAEVVFALANPKPTSDAAARLGVTGQTIRNWVRAGRLTGQKVGDRYVVEEASIVAMAAERERSRP